MGVQKRQVRMRHVSEQVNEHSSRRLIQSWGNNSSNNDRNNGKNTHIVLAMPSLLYCVSHSSRVQLFVTPWTAACQAPLSMEFSRQEYWSGLPFPSPCYVPGASLKAAPTCTHLIPMATLQVWYYYQPLSYK